MRESATKSERKGVPEHSEKLGEPGGERGPSRAGNKVAVNDGIGHREIDVRSSSKSNVGAGGGVGAALLPLQDPSGGENLRGVAEGGDGLVGFCEVANDFDDARIEPNVL